MAHHFQVRKYCDFCNVVIEKKQFDIILVVPIANVGDESQIATIATQPSTSQASAQSQQILNPNNSTSNQGRGMSSKFLFVLFRVIF